jgi:methyl-accepting chemotaxis protein
MDSMTQQNAALVEQAGAAALSLEEQAQQLREAVAAFRVDGRRVASVSETTEKLGQVAGVVFPRVC